MEIQEQKPFGTNAKETSNSKSSELETKTEKIENTPFIMRWEKENGYSFGLGNYRISRYYETETELKKELKKKEWTHIAGLIGVIVDATLRQYNLIK